ncbi:MAG: hypothetical protein HON90_02340 [Halobacteriovoraceae bacterium]|jgi:hypothetical protein|nr:hypothetical protein [Halobacteriovoraceae bacterium]
MKKSIVLLAVLTTTSLFASTPQIQFSNNGFSHRTSIFNVCVTENDLFRTINKVALYELGGTGDNQYPTSNGSAEYLYASRTYSKEYCLKNECGTFDDFETITETLPLSYRIEVTGEEIGDSGMYEVLSVKKHTITSCK